VLILACMMHMPGCDQGLQVRRRAAIPARPMCAAAAPVPRDVVSCAAAFPKMILALPLLVFDVVESLQSSKGRYSKGEEFVREVGPLSLKVMALVVP
jgi:hypothetical protein